MKVEVWVATNKIGSKCTKVVEFDDEEWNEMTDTDREEALEDTMRQMIEWGWNEK